jgi:hypothetical protein
MEGDKSCFERVEEFKYLGTTLTDQNSIKEEIKSRLKVGNACYHSVENLLSSSLLSKNLKNPEGPATGHPYTVFAWFPCVLEQMLGWFPTLPSCHYMLPM